MLLAMGSRPPPPARARSPCSPGEFNTSATDVTVPGSTGGVSRSLAAIGPCGCSCPGVLGGTRLVAPPRADSLGTERWSPTLNPNGDARGATVGQSSSIAARTNVRNWRDGCAFESREGSSIDHRSALTLRLRFPCEHRRPDRHSRRCSCHRRDSRGLVARGLSRAAPRQLPQVAVR